MPLARTLLLLVVLALAGAAQAAPGPGDIAPVQLGRTLDGDPVSLADYPGKVVVVSFWATWCPYCLKELPILENIQNAAKGAAQVVAVNTEERDVFRKVVRALKDLKLQLSRDVDGKAAAAYGVNGIPHLVIIGRDGRIVKVYRGYGEESLDGIVADLNKALQAPQAEAAPAAQ